MDEVILLNKDSSTEISNKHNDELEDKLDSNIENNEKENEEMGKVEESGDKEVLYDDDDDEDEEDDEFVVLTKTSSSNDISSPNKNMFSIKTISNIQSHNNYKLSRTAVDLNHPGNINGVPTIEYDLSKLVDEFKPWKKPGADITDYFNYGFTEETWLLYCDKQKNLRLSQDNSALKTLSGFQNFGYPLSGSHIHLGMNRGSQNMDTKNNKHNDMSIGNKISTIPVQTGGLPVNQNQTNNLISNLANSAMTNNPLNQFMAAAAMAMGFPPNTGTMPPVLPQTGPIDSKMSHFNPMDGGGPRGHFGGPPGLGSNHNMVPPNVGNWNGPNDQNMGGGGFERENSCDSMRSNEDYGERKLYVKTERRREKDDRDNRRHRSRERRDRSPDRRRKSRSRDKEREYESRPAKRRHRSNSRKHRRHNSKDHRDSGSITSSKRHRGETSGRGGERSSSRRHKRTRRSHSKSNVTRRVDDGREESSRQHRKRHRHNRSTTRNEENGNNGNIDNSTRDSISTDIRTKREPE